MSDGSSIEWLARPGTSPASWNPVHARDRETGKVGWHCVKVSEGCRNCYAEGLNNRFGTGRRFAAQEAASVEIFLDEKILCQPLRWRKPRTVFVESMSDIGADFVRRHWLVRMLAVMAVCPEHVFIILTKRPGRLGALLDDLYFNESGNEDLGEAIEDLFDVGPYFNIPLPNVWVGASVHDQKSADAIVPEVLKIPAAVRWISYEPALGPVEFAGLDFAGLTIDCANGVRWIGVGGESGPGARRCDIEDIRSTIEQGRAAGVPVFVKQLGARPVGRDGPFKLKHRKGGDISEWPEDLRVREWPS